MSRVLVTASPDGVFEVRMNDAVNSNHLGDELCARLSDALSEIAADPALKVVVLTGTPEVFCGGASLETLSRLCGGSTTVKDLELPGQLIGYPVVIVAALEGDAVGGGLMLAVCSDIAVAAENRRFGLNFTTLGFAPGMGATQLLPSLVGHCTAIEMLLTGKFYKGRELANRGLFNAVVAHDQVRAVAFDLARRIAERPRYVIEMVKSALAEPRLRLLQEALDREHLLHKSCFGRVDIGRTIADSY